jgi:hypothetical protein
MSPYPNDQPRTQQSKSVPTVVVTPAILVVAGQSIPTRAQVS